jgi:exopolysaccharide biosynthesis polyprenyl glycosylphosphotransferase
MVAQRARGILSIHLLCQVFGAVFLFWASLLVIQTSYAADVFTMWNRYVIYCGCVAIGLLLEHSQYRRTKTLVGETSPLRGSSSLRQLLYVTGVIAFFLVAAKDKSVSRAFLVFFLPLLYVFLFTSNRFLPRCLARLLFSGSHAERTLLVGSAYHLAILSSWSKRRQNLGMQILGTLTSDPKAGNPVELPVLGTAENLEEVICQRGVTQVILGDEPQLAKPLNQFVQICEKWGVRLLLYNDLEDQLGCALTYFEDDGLHFISLREEPLENPLNRSLKRVLDIAISLPVVVLVLPVATILVWLLQRLQSPGPIFYAQSRAGIQNQEFQIFKFRTMHLGNDDEARQASQNDDRIFPAGHWLRRFSIDELPQFWNVLRGEMSVVGPRPHLLQHNDEFASRLRNYRVRSVIKPGLTGLAQVTGYRGPTPTSAALSGRLQADIRYIETWSLILDLRIILRTIHQLFFPPPTAY